MNIRQQELADAILIPCQRIKGVFPNENSRLKLLYVDTQNASKKWTMPIQN